MPTLSRKQAQIFSTVDSLFTGCSLRIWDLYQGLVFGTRVGDLYPGTASGAKKQSVGVFAGPSVDLIEDLLIEDLLGDDLNQPTLHLALMVKVKRVLGLRKMPGHKTDK